MTGSATRVSLTLLPGPGNAKSRPHNPEEDMTPDASAPDDFRLASRDHRLGAQERESSVASSAQLKFNSSRRFCSQRMAP